MPTFTVPLFDAIKYTGGTVEIVSGIRRLTNPNCIGLGQYPIYDLNYRNTLNGKIVDHYWNREIGLESVDMFVGKMRIKMNEIMPYFNEMYRSTQLTFDPLKTIDMQTVATGSASSEREASVDNSSTANSTTIGENSAKSLSRNVNSTFPQMMLSGSGDYADSGADATASTESASEGTESATTAQESAERGSEDALSESDSRTSGYQGLPSDMLMRYRDSIVNVDLMVINELQDLFMGIWDSSDSYSNSVWTY